MRCDKKMMALYAVTDRAWVGTMTLEEQVEAALKGGVTCVQLREKHLDEAAFLAEAKKIAALCQKYRVPLIINDKVEIAVACGADGVHVGQEDMRAGEVRKRIGNDMILGVSVHTVEEALEAAADGADYLGLGAAFATSTKTDVDVMSREMMQAICHAVDLPTVAIGGIKKDNVSKLAGSGVDGIAVVSAIFGADDIEKATAELSTRVEAMLKGCHTMPTALSIAGSDSSGGAGIQADLKTMIMQNVYGMSAVTALTAQNTMGVKSIMPVTEDFLKQQLDAVFEDIFPDAVKIGMVPSGELMTVIADRLKFYQAKNIILDPVMVATSGSTLMENAAVKILKSRLLPLADLVTPNIPEAEVLSDMKIQDENDMIAAAKKISAENSCAVLVKGGHSVNDANDLLFADGQITWFKGERIDNPNTHGTGCTLSSAIAANLAKGQPMVTAIENAKAYLTAALRDMLDLGNGSGPVNHCVFRAESWE